MNGQTFSLLYTLVIIGLMIFMVIRSINIIKIGKKNKAIVEAIQKVDDENEFNEYIDIGQFVKYSYNTQYKYKLIGIVINECESGVSEHFIAYCRSPIDDKWYSYNDDLCFPVNDLKNEAIDWGIPYILFYQNM